MVKIERKKKTKEFYWVNRDEGTFCMDGEVHNLSEYDLNEVFRGSCLNDGVLEKHFRVIQLMRDIDADCYYTKYMDFTSPEKDSQCIQYRFLCGNVFALHTTKECKRFSELLSLVDDFCVCAPLEEERAKEHGNHILCVAFSINNVWKKSNLDYIRQERKEYKGNDKGRYD